MTVFSNPTPRSTASESQEVESDPTSQEERLERLLSELEVNLKETSPQEGINRFLKSKRGDITQKTLDEYKDKLDHFERFCERNEITDLRDLDGRTLDDYEWYRQYESSDQVDELSTNTMRDELYLLRNLVEYLEKINAVRRGLSELIEIPELDDGEGIRDIDMDPDRVEAVLEYLSKFRYATLEHVIWVIVAQIGRRTGAYIGLDLDDAHLEGDNPYLEFSHRPPETPLKNKNRGEEQVAISKDVAEVIAQFIEQNRPNVTDDQGRDPLLATSYGRIASSTFRRYIYKWSRPCAIGSDCPYDRDPEDCEAAQSMDPASKCPSSRSPHALRHGYITQGRREGVPIEVLSARCDVSEEVLREVYDETDPDERRELRRDILDEYTSNNGGGYI